MSNACRSHAERMPNAWQCSCDSHVSACVRHAFDIRSTCDFFATPTKLVRIDKSHDFSVEVQKMWLPCGRHAIFMWFPSVDMRSACVSSMPNAWESHENRMNGWESHRNHTPAVTFYFSLPYPSTLHDTLRSTVLLSLVFSLFPGSSIQALSTLTDVWFVETPVGKWSVCFMGQQNSKLTFKQQRWPLLSVKYSINFIIQCTQTHYRNLWCILVYTEGGPS
jgi:hypothetical protein